jgi:phage head maturation protease
MNKQFSAKWKITKSTTQDGAFYVEGYASTGNPDSSGDKISIKAMEQLTEMIKGVVLLHNHDPDQEVGRVKEAKYVGEDNAVWVKAIVNDEETVEKVKDGRLDGFSIHALAGEYRIVHSKGNTEFIIEGWERVVELTITAVPMNEEAKIMNYYVASFRKAILAEQADQASADLEEIRTAKIEVQKMLDQVKALAGTKDPEPEPTPDPDPDPKPEADPEPEPDPEKTQVPKPEDEPKPEADPEKQKADVDVDDEAKFLSAQADALSNVEIDGDAGEAVGLVVASLRNRAEEIKSEDGEGEEDKTKSEEPAPEEDPPAPEMDPEIQKQIDAVKAENERLKADVDTLKKAKSKQVTDLDDDDKKDKPKKRKPFSFGMTKLHDDEDE